MLSSNFQSDYLVIRELNGSIWEMGLIKNR